MVIRAGEGTAGRQKSDSKSMKVRETSYLAVVWVNVSLVVLVVVVEET